MLTDEDRAGIGVIIRDSQGTVMASMSHNITLPISVVELKTLAVAKALEFSIDLRFVSAILEGDSKIVMKSLMDVKTYVEQFQYISFSYVGSEGNSVVHNLVKHAWYITGFFFVWMEDISLHTFDIYH